MNAINNSPIFFDGISVATYRLISGVESAFLSIVATFKLWSHRSKSRRALAHLSRAMLDDIGLTRLDAAREANKSFWRA